MSTLFFYAMKYKVDVPQDPANDRFVLSKVRSSTGLILYFWSQWRSVISFTRNMLLY